jgi:hypothetical protein
MWPFNRQQQSTEDSNLPEEVKQYYEAERREHIGVAWLLAFVTLVLTVAVIAGLFVSGRWAYRKYVHKTPAKTQTATQTNVQPQIASGAQSTTSSSGSSPTKTVSKPTTPPTVTAVPSHTSNQSTGQNPAKANPTAPVSSAAPSPTPPAATSTSPTTSSTTNKKLANTGPGDTVAIFVCVSVLAALGHGTYSRRKLG